MYTVGEYVESYKFNTKHAVVEWSQTFPSLLNNGKANCYNIHNCADSYIFEME